MKRQYYKVPPDKDYKYEDENRNWNKAPFFINLYFKILDILKR